MTPAVPSHAPSLCVSSVPLHKTREAPLTATGQYLPTGAPAFTLLQQAPLTGLNLIILTLRVTSHIPQKTPGSLVRRVPQ